MKHFLTGFAVTVAAVVVGIIAAPYVTSVYAKPTK